MAGQNRENDIRVNFSVNLLAHWVDKTKWFFQTNEENPAPFPVDDYLIFNTRLGYSFLDQKAELSLSVFNLFNHTHYEYPPGDNAALPNSEKIGRKITFTLRYTF